MSTPIPIRISIFIVLLILVPASLAQPKSSAADPQNKPRKIKAEPAKAFKKWIEDVEPIITPEELKAWNKLRTLRQERDVYSTCWAR